VQNDDILSFAKLFNDELTLDNISRPRLLSMCKYMNIQPYGTDAYLRYSLRTKLSWYTLLDFKPLSRAGLWTFALFVVLEAPSWSVVQPGFGLQPVVWVWHWCWSMHFLWTAMQPSWNICMQNVEN
jgi:hypothetical protein